MSRGKEGGEEANVEIQRTSRGKGYSSLGGYQWKTKKRSCSPKRINKGNKLDRNVTPHSGHGCPNCEEKGEGVLHDWHRKKTRGGIKGEVVRVSKIEI